MKRLQRIFYRRIHMLDRSTRRIRGYLTAARALLVLEGVALYGALIFALTKSHISLTSRFGSYVDTRAMILALGLLGLLQVFLNRRVVAALGRRFSPEAYDERRILFDLGQAARTATTIEQLYQLAVDKIKEALHTSNVSIFVRDDKTGDYVCRISSPQPEAAGVGVKGKEGERLALASNAFVVKRLRNISAPLGVEPDDFTAWTRALASAPPAIREARKRESETLQRIDSRLLLQIMMKDQLIGIISLGPRPGKRGFSADDKQMLTAVAGQMAFVIEHSNLVGRMVEEERLRHELALATEVQQRLFPALPPASDSLELSGFCQPAREVGGDYYDFLELDHGEIGIAVADVAGKGMAAALLMSMVQASLRSHAGTSATAGMGQPLADLVRAMNRLLWRSTGASSYVTFFYAQFDEATRQLTYVNAGHNPPLLLRANNAGSTVLSEQRTSLYIDRYQRATCALAFHPDVETGTMTAVLEDPAELIMAADSSAPPCLKLTTGGLVIGAFEDCYYEQETIRVESGDLLVAYTDGVTEALNAEGEEFGEARLQETLASLTHLTAEQVRDSLLQRLRLWCEGAPQHDDLTFVVMKAK